MGCDQQHGRFGEGIVGGSGWMEGLVPRAWTLSGTQWGALVGP